MMTAQVTITLSTNKTVCYIRIYGKTSEGQDINPSMYHVSVRV